MTRHDLRNPYPFHAVSPRQYTHCCLPRRMPTRRTWLQRVLSRLFG